MLHGIGNATWSGIPRIVSWKPMATVYDNFLSEEEADYILQLARPLMEPAMLVNSDKEKHMKSRSRTSHGAFFDSFQNPILSMITHRIAHVARIPPGAPRSCVLAQSTVLRASCLLVLRACRDAASPLSVRTSTTRRACLPFSLSSTVLSPPLCYQ